MTKVSDKLDLHTVPIDIGKLRHQQRRQVCKSFRRGSFMKRFILLLVLLSIPVSVTAQTIPRIGLYTDASGITSTTFVDPFEIFEVYVCVTPGDNGFFCAEYALEFDQGLVLTSYQGHPDVSVELGGLPNGISTCMSRCREGWTVLHTISVFNTTTNPAGIRIVKHPGSGYHRVVNCLDSRDKEPTFAYPPVCVNEACLRDDEPPEVINAIITNETEIVLQMNERVFLPDVEDLTNYLVYMQQDDSVTLPVLAAELQGDDDRIWLLLGSSPGDDTYVLELSGIRDMAGHAIPSGTAVFFERIPPEVTGVTVKSSGLVRVEFSEPLSGLSACDPANYRIFEDADTTALMEILSADQDYAPGTVTLSVGSPLDGTRQYVLRVSGVADVAGNTIDPGNSHVFSGRDGVAPELVSHSIIGESTILLAFDETMDAASATDLNMFWLHVSDDLYDELEIGSITMVDERTVRLETAVLPVLERSYTLRIFNVRDVALNVADPILIELVFEDTVPPELIEAVVMTDRAVRLQFSEMLHEGTAADPGHYSIYPAGYPSQGLPIVSAGRIDDGSAVMLHLGASLTHNNWVASATGIYDMYGNAMLDVQTALFQFIDIVVPFVTLIDVVNMLEVRLTFNEPLDMTGPDDGSNYTFFEAGDTSVNFIAETAALGSDQATVTLKPSRPLSPDLQYLLRVAGLSDIVGNWIDPDSLYGFTAAEDVLPELTGYVTSGDSMVTLTFSEPLDPAAVAEPGGITIFESRNPSVSLAIASIEVAGEGRVVNLTLLDRAAEGVPYTLGIEGLADLAGNIILPAQREYIYFGEGEDRPHPILAEAAGHREVVVRFDRQLDINTAQNASNYYLFTTADTTSVRYVTLARLLPDGYSVHITVDRTFLNDFHLTIRISGVRDIYGNTIAERSEVQFYYTDHFAPGFDTASCLSDRRIRVVFDEPVDSATASVPENYIVYRPDNPDMTVPVDHVEFFGWSVVLNTAEPLSFAPAYPVSGSSVDSLASGEERDMLTCSGVRYAIACDGVEDCFGNAMCPENTIEFIFWDSYPPELFSIRVLTPASIYLSFSEVMSITRADDPWRYEVFPAGGTSPIASVVMAEYLGRHVVLHLAGPLSAGECELRFDYITDYGENAVSDVPAPFTYSGYPSGAVVGLYADDQRSGSVISVPGVGEQFSFYVWCRGSESEMSAVRYAIGSSSRWELTGIAVNDAVVSGDSGYPVDQGMIGSLEGSHEGWIWTHRIDCISLAEGEEFITVLPSFPLGELAITNCLIGNPYESASAGDSIYLFVDLPLETLLERWIAEYRLGSIEITWTISTTDEIPSFSVSRQAEGGGDPVGLPSGTVTRDGLSFRVVDTGFQHGRSYRYRIALDEDGGEVILFETGVISTPELPLTLRQNVPNPFNPSTEISYHLPEQCEVSLDVYDVAGRRIVRLVSWKQPVGDHSVTWNGTDDSGGRVGSGVYFYSLRAGKHELTRKMVLLR